MIGVDIIKDQVSRLAWVSLLKAMLYGLFLGVIAFPLVAVYLRSMRERYREKVEVLQKHSLTSLPNKRSLKNILDKGVMIIC